MSDHVNKPDIGLKTQEEIKLKVSEVFASGENPASQDSAEKNNESESIEKSSKKASEKDDASKTVNPSGANEQTADEKTEPPSPTAVQFHKPKSSGLKRHNAIVAVCSILSCSFLGLSAVDLKHLIGKPAAMTADGKITYLKERPELPPSFTYTNTAFSEWGNQEDYMDLGDASADKLLQVAKHTWDGRKLGYVNMAGNIVVPPKFAMAGYFHEGLAAVQIGSKESLKWGFIDETGNFKIPPKFEQTGGFHNGAAPAEIEGRCGLIDRTGNFILKPSLRSISELGANFQAHTLRGQVGILSPAGKWLLLPVNGRITSFKESNHHGINYPFGLLRNSYNSTSHYKDKIYKIQVNSQVGIIDENGKYVVPPMYDDVVSFSDGVAAVKVNGKIGFTKGDGKYIIQPQFDQTTQFADLIAVRNYSKPWSFINRSGNAIKAPVVDDIITDHLGNWFCDGLGPFIQNGKVGYMNTNGDVVIKPQFEFGMPFVSGHAEVWTGDYWRVIDTKGKFVPDLVLQNLSVFINGRALAMIPGLFYPLVEFSNLNSMRESMKIWKENSKARQPAPSEPLVEY